MICNITIAKFDEMVYHIFMWYTIFVLGGIVMKKYRVWLNTGFAGVNNEDVIEIDDDATPEEIDEQCRDYAFNDIDWGYEEIEDEL